MAITPRTPTVSEVQTSSVAADTSTAQVGDCMLLSVSADQNINTPTGWTLCFPQIDQVVNCAVFRRFKDGTANDSPTITTSSATRLSTICEPFGGVDTTTPLDGVTPSTVDTSSTASSINVPSITTNTNGGYAVTGYAMDATAQTYAATLSGTGWSETAETTGTGRRQGVGTKSMPTAGATGAATWAQSGSALTMIGWQLALKPSASGGGGGTVPVVRDIQTASQGNSPTSAPAKPNGLAVGDLLVGFQMSDADGTLNAMTAPSGFLTEGTPAAVNTSTNIPGFKVWTKIATSTDVAASTFSFPDDTGANSAVALAAIQAGTFDPNNPIAAIQYSSQGSASNASITAPSVAGVTNGLLLTGHASDTGGTARNYTGTPSGMSEIADVAASGGYATLGIFKQTLASSGSTGAKTATLSATPDGYAAVALVINPPTGGSGGGGGQTYTLGKSDDPSSSSASSANKTAASLVTADNSGVLKTGHAHLWMSGGSTTARMVVYANSGGSPGALLAQSDELTVSNTSDDVINFTFSGGQQINIVSGTSYWVGPSWADPGTDSINIGRDSDANGRMEASAYVPSPFGTATPFTGPVAAWVQYESVPSGTPVTVPLTVVGTSSVATGTTSCAPGYPAGTTTDDITYMYVHVKATANTHPSLTTPTDWVLVGSYRSTIAISSTVPGAGTGPTTIFVYRRQHTSVPSGTVTVAPTNSNSVQAFMRTYRPSMTGGTVSETMWPGRSVTAGSTTMGGSLTVAAADIKTDDWVELAWGIADDDTTTMTYGSPTCTGVTFAAFTAGPSVSVNALGNDQAIGAIYGKVNSGSNTGTSLTVTATSNVANTAIEVGFRIRVTKYINAPTVNAGANASVAAGATFTRTASESGDAPTSRAWTIVSGPTGVGSTIGTAQTLSWTPSTAGTYNIRYTATNAGGSGTDDVTVTVTAITAPVVNAGADAAIFTGETFTRTGQETGGSAPTSRAWTIQAGPAGVGTTISTAAALSWTPGTAGTYTLRYAATNTAGTGTDDVSVIVSAPSAPIVNAGADASVTAGVEFSRTATDSANGSAITARSWTLVGGPFDVGTVLASADALNWTPGVPGSYTLRYSATNGIGTTTDDLTLTVTAAPATPTMPELITAYASGGRSVATSYVTPSFTPEPGEVIIVKFVNGYQNDPIANTPTGTGLTFAKPTGVSAAAPGTTWGDATVYVATAGQNPSATTVTCPVSSSGTHAFVVERWRNATVAATPATNATKTDNTSPYAQPVTTTQENSVVTAVITDYNAVNPGTPTYSANNVTSVAATYASGAMTGYWIYCPAPTIGAYTVGVSAPSGQKDSIAAMELLGIAGGVAAPTANAGVDASTAPNQQFSRTGGETGSGITERQWKITSGPAGVGTILSTAAALTWTPTVAGTYVLEYSTGNTGGVATDTATITVVDPSPVVGAGADATVVVNTAFNRTATETNSPTSRSWTIQSGPAGVGTTIGNAAALSWTPTVVGVYVLRYSASNVGGTGTDDVTVTVVYPVPTAGAGSDVNNFVVNTEFTRTATENAFGATITARTWKIQSGPAGVGSTIGTAAALAWTPTTTGTYVLRYTVTSSGGTAYDEMTILVVLPAPTVDAGADATVLRDAVFSRTATEDGGGITAREWRIISGPTGVNSVIGTAAALSWTPTVVGAYVLRYTATNATGSGQAEITVTVHAPPTVNAGADASVTNRTPFARTGTEQANNATITERSWTVHSGPADVGTVLSTTTVVNWTPTVPGTYVLRFSATNAAGTSTDDLTLTVNAVVYSIAGVAEAISSGVGLITTAFVVSGDATSQTTVSADAEMRIAQRQEADAAIAATATGQVWIAGRAASAVTAVATATSSARRWTPIAGSSLATSSGTGRAEVVAVVLGTASIISTATADAGLTRPITEAAATAIATGTAQIRPVTTLAAEPMEAESIVIRANLELPVPWIARAVPTIRGKLTRATRTSKTITSVASVVGTPDATRVGVWRDVHVTADTDFPQKKLTRLPILRAYPLRVYGDATLNGRVVRRYADQIALAEAIVPPTDTLYTSRLAASAVIATNTAAIIERAGRVQGSAAATSAATSTARCVTGLSGTITAQASITVPGLARIREIAGQVSASVSAALNTQRRIHTLHQEAQADSAISEINLERVVRYTQQIVRIFTRFGERPPRFVQVTDQGDGRARVRSYREVIKVRGIATAAASAQANLIWAPKRHPARAIATAIGYLKPVRRLHRTVSAQSSVRHRFIIVPRMTDIVQYYPLPGDAVSPTDADLDTILDAYDPYPTIYNFFILR